MISIVGALLAGLGMFFAGLQILTEHLKRLSGRRLLTLVARYTRNPRSAAALRIDVGPTRRCR